MLVRWDDGATNGVSAGDLQYESPLRKGSTATMMWEGLPWEATALGVNNSEDQENTTESESDVPLATIVQAASM